jgi:spore maturation protein SpmB|tara:strand:+ start:431 stop:1387 length:957 start_codon:yes stop_codon:yes gene_type:complete
MKKSKKILVNIFQETTKIFWILFKVILPVVIVIRALELIGAIPFLAKFLEPLTSFIGIDGSLGLVWMAAILVNIYAGLAAFASLQAIFDYSVAETTILGLIILIAHSLPIEVAIAKKSRISWIFNLSFRFINAIVAGKILNLLFTKYELFNEPNQSVLQVPNELVSNFEWATLQIQNFFIIFLIIFFIISTINVLKAFGVWSFIIHIMKIPLSYLGMSEKVANIILIGLTLGISFGGGFLIEESKKNNISKKDILLSLSFLSLCHSIIEDTILILLLGSHISGILFFRFIYTVIIILLMKILLETKMQKFILSKLTDG